MRDINTNRDHVIGATEVLVDDLVEGPNRRIIGAVVGFQGRDIVVRQSDNECLIYDAREITYCDRAVPQRWSVIG